ncbi:minor tail protein [Microbacterium phage Mercedes]|nr:minor tail protein [Microbacterium phage Mercedes]
MAIIPVRSVSTQEVLYGDRVTSYRWEVLEHSNGVDQLVGTLDGVADGRLTWTQNAAVKGGGKAEVVDLAASDTAPGMLRIGNLKLESARLRPVCVVQGLPENPLGVFLVSAAKEEWEATGRVWQLELLDKCTVPQQDQVDQSYAVAAGTLILQQVKIILASCGEYIAIDNSSTLATSSGMVWEAGTSKLKIINDLLEVAGYNSLWMDGYGNFQLTPRVLPANRSLTYDVLGIPRELRDGSQSIYTPDWNRDKDSFDVPNKVVAVQAAGGDDAAALVGQWTNEDASSPYSYQQRGGRWLTHTLDSVEVPEGTDAEVVAFLQNRARATLIQMSAVQATVKLEHLPIPVRVGDVVRFANSKAGIDGRHVITRLQLDTHPLGMMSSTLQEVVSL